jgi:hypothetical protein
LDKWIVQVPARLPVQALIRHSFIPFSLLLRISYTIGVKLGKAKTGLSQQNMSIVISDPFHLVLPDELNRRELSHWSFVKPIFVRGAFPY